MPTEANICNLALFRVGSKKTIASLTENSTEAKACALLFDQARDAVLEDRPWRFATRRATLALTSGLTKDGWAYVYDAPSDCVAPRRIWSGTRNPGHGADEPFATEHDPAYGLVILSDRKDAILLYTARLKDTGYWPAGFVEALSWKLGYELAFMLPVKPGVGAEMLKAYRLALDNAFANELNGQKEDAQPEAEWVRSRS